MFADKLKKSVLQAAIQGKLTEQLSTDGDAKDLLKQIRAEKSKLIAEGKIKSEKILPPIQPDEIPFDIPKNWQWVRLGEILKFVQYGTAKKSKKNGVIPVLRMGNLRNGKIDFKNLVYTSDENDIKNYNLQPEDILFNRTNSVELVGKTAIYNGERNAIFAGYLIRLQTIFTNNYFLNFLMQSTYYKNFCYLVQTRGVSQSNINAEKLKKFLVPLPPLVEQKRIVERLEKIFAEVELLAESERELDNLQKNFPRRMKNSILQAAILGKLTEQLSTDGDARELLKKIREEKSKLISEGKIKAEKILPSIQPYEIPFDIPKNWQWIRLGEICEYIQRGKSPKYSTVKKYPVIAQKCNQTTGFCIDKAKFIEPDSIKSYSDERFLQDNDLLWNSTGLGTVGRMAIYETSKNPYELAVADSHVTVIRPFKNFVANKFIFNYIISPAIQENIETMVSGSTKQKELATQTVKELLIPLPPLAEQKRIVERLEELLPLCDG